MNNDDKELFAAMGKDLDEAIVVINKKVIKNKQGPEDYAKTMYRYLREVGLRKPRCWVTFEIPKRPEHYLLYGNSRIQLDDIGKYKIHRFLAKRLKELRDIENKVCKNYGTIGNTDGKTINYNGTSWTLGKEKGQLDWIKFLFACDPLSGLLVGDILPHAEKMKCYSSGDELDTFKGMYDGDCTISPENEAQSVPLVKGKTNVFSVSNDKNSQLAELADYLNKTLKESVKQKDRK